MSISTTIKYVTPSPDATVEGSQVPLLNDASGYILHAGQQVKELNSVVDGDDSQVTLRIASNGAHSVIVSMVEITPATFLSQPDVGGVTWCAVANGQDVTFIAPALPGSKRTYEFDSPPSPPVKLRITVERA